VIVLEGDAATNCSAYVPDLPGCVAAGATIEETVRLIREAMALHLAAMRRDGDPIPAPTTRLGDPALELTEDAVGVVEVTAAAALAASSSARTIVACHGSTAWVSRVGPGASGASPLTSLSGSKPP
jgi:predicted RNase H-like HicB family nuclease